MSYARSAVTRMTLDMSRLDLQRSETVTQGDTNRRWEVTLINGGAPFRLPPNWTAALTGIKPDGNGLQNGCSVVDGKIIYDFAVGKEIATCVGSYPVQFDVWDEVGNLVASPKIYVNVLADVRPHAELESNGQYTQIGDLIGRTNENDEKIDELVKQMADMAIAMMERYTKSGSITIPVSEWSDMMPTTAYVGIQGGEALVKGGLLLVTPADEATKKECERTGVRVDIDLVTDNQPPLPDQIVFIRADEAPTIPLNFEWYAFRAESEQNAAVVMFGVYSSGACGGVNKEQYEEIVKRLVPEWARAKNPPPSPVTKVNGQTGEVNLPIPAEAADVGADPEGTAERMTTALRQEVTTALNALIKSSDLPAKLDEYRAAKGLINKTVSDLVNYYTKSQTLNKDEINALVSAIPKFDIEVVASLPIYNISETTVYLVKSGADSSNLYTEYIRANGAWERLGTQTVDLTGYATEAWVNEIIAAYVKTADMEAYVAGLLKDYITKDVADETYQPAGDYLARNELNGAINTALEEAKESGDFDGTSVTVSSVTESDKSGGSNVVEFSDGKTVTVKNGKDGKTPVKGEDYYTPEEEAEWETFIATELAKRGQIKPEIVDSIEKCTDTTKLYWLPDNYIYAYLPVKRLAYDNILSTAVDTDGKPYNGGLGYKQGIFINSSNVESANSTRATTGYIPVREGDDFRVKDIVKPNNTGGNFLFYSANFAYIAPAWYGNYAEPNGEYSTLPDENGIITITIPKRATPVAYVRVSTGTINENSIFTINQEITDEMITTYEWRSTGRALVPADYEDRIIDLEEAATDHEERLAEVEAIIESGNLGGDKTFEERVEAFKEWDRPVYDKAATYTIGDEAKVALTDTMRTSTALYKAYDDLMEAVNTDTWTYVAKTLLGQDSAGYDVYRYDFKMPEKPKLYGNSSQSKAVPKVILVSGVHPEWAGVYALYNTMVEIATNPDLADLKHNTHFVVLPMVNAYSCNSGNRKNINGVDIARNFEVDWVAVTDTSATTYGGTEPLSELEAQYVDSVMAGNTDALYFVSCHNFFGEDDDLDLNLWGAVATKFFDNICQKLVDKLTRAWGGKYDFCPANTYLGATEMSATPGTEAKQAIKYGIHGGTLECRHKFPAHSLDTYTAFSMSRATEVYINFLLTALGNHEAQDKRQL